MDEKNGIELPMNGESDEAASEQVKPSEETPEAADGQDPGEAAPDATPAAEAEVEEKAPGDLLSTEEIDSAMQNAAAEELTLSGPTSGQDEPAIKQADFQQLSVASGKLESRNIELLMDVDLPVSIELGRTRMHISEILALGPGSIVELDKLVGEPVDLLVNQKKVARGEVVVVEENFGLRITQLVSPEERLKNLQ